MAKVFEALSELVQAIVPGAAESAFLIKYRNKDHYVLAGDLDEALATFAAEVMNIEAGPVSLDLIVAAIMGNGSVNPAAADTASAKPAAADTASAKPAAAAAGKKSRATSLPAADKPAEQGELPGVKDDAKK